MVSKFLLFCLYIFGLCIINIFISKFVSKFVSIFLFFLV